MVSIIIPVYNAEKYLRECIDSVLHQTEANIEVICVDDGSTDNSLSILKEYKLRDKRIILLQEENLGQGCARNYALSHAQGDFVMFVDSDDWLEVDCVEKLLKYTNENVIGRIGKTFFESREIAIVLKEVEEKLIDSDNKRTALFNITTYPVARLIRRKLFTKHNILFNNHYFEDVAILPVIYAMATKIIIIDDVVYYYRNNQGSTVNRMDVIYDRIKCLNTLTCEFKKRKLFTMYEKELVQYILERCQINLRCTKGLCNRFYMKFEEAQNTFIHDNFDLNAWKSAKVYSFGSYNLMIIAKIFMGYEDSAVIDNYYGGQSIISCMNTNNSRIRDVSVYHENAFRRECLLQDFEKRFAQLNPGEFNGIDYIFLDLLEERFDIGICRNGDCFTLSDYFNDIGMNLNLEYSVVKSFSDEWYCLWEKACNKFVERLKIYISEDKIVMVKMKLSERYYLEEHEYEFKDIGKIKRVNENLERCYKIFIDKVPKATVICIDRFKDFCTNKNFRHGCYSWHLNDGFYLSAAKYIKRKLYDECSGV